MKTKGRCRKPQDEVTGHHNKQDGAGCFDKMTADEMIDTYVRRGKHLPREGALQVVVSDDIEYHTLDRNMLTFMMEILIGAVRVWERDALPGGHRHPLLPCPSFAKALSDKGRRWGRCFILALPSRAHMTMLMPHLGHWQDIVTDDTPWKRYLHLMDVRMAMRALEIPPTDLPRDDSVLFVVGWHTAKRVPVEGAHYFGSCSRYPQTEQDPEARSQFSHMRAYVPAETWDAFDQLESWMDALMYGRVMALKALLANTVNDSPLADQMHGLPTSLQIARLQSTCLRCGKALNQGACGKVLCLDCRFISFCSVECCDAAQTEQSGGLHHDKHCCCANLLYKGLMSDVTRNLWLALEREERRILWRMDDMGRFRDPAFSTLMWDVSQPPDVAARIIPGVMHAYLTWRVRHLADFGEPLTPRHCEALTRVRYGDRITLSAFGSVTLVVRAQEDEAAGPSGSNGAPVPVMSLLRALYRALSSPVPECVRRRCGSDRLAPDARVVDLNPAARRFVGLVPKSWYPTAYYRRLDARMPRMVISDGSDHESDCEQRDATPAEGSSTTSAHDACPRLGVADGVHGNADMIWQKEGVVSHEDVASAKFYAEDEDAELSAADEPPGCLGFEYRPREWRLRVQAVQPADLQQARG